MIAKALCAAAFLLHCAAFSYGSVFGTVRGVVHDPKHHPIQGASVSLNAQSSDWAQTAVTGADGEFQFIAVPAGRYLVSVSEAGFRTDKQALDVQSGSAPVLHFALSLAAADQTVEVSAAPVWINPGSSASENIVSRGEIAKSPGADRTNSLAMITNFTPGAYIVHDQLHIRGGHQVSWMVDGIPVPNTNIAGNVGPQLDPKDIDYLEIKRGGDSAQYGDRIYGILNVVPRSGFERDNEAELLLSYGSFHEGSGHLSLGGHTQRFAYYGSISGNRTDLGLQTPTAEVLHDSSASVGGFTSLIYNPNSTDQFRLSGSVRGDHYQVPNTPEQQDLGIRDIQQEQDAFLNGSWVRTLSPNLLLTISPFYHRNRAALEGGPGDTPVIARDERVSGYLGSEASLSLATRRHNARAGFSVWGQRDRNLFELRASDPTGPVLQQSQSTSGNLEALYAEDQFRIFSWFTVNGGVRWTHFSGDFAENATSPRIGASLRVPRLKWVIRGFYGRYYQAPPLTTVSGPLLDLALEQGFGFLPLYGERNEQKEIGLAIPFRGWAIDLNYFHTNARNFFDHTPLGNSSIFLPLTIEAARMRGLEATVRSPRLFHRAELHMVYSRQYVQGKGPITGGLTDFSPSEDDWFYLDHDQRDTFAGGFEVDGPWKSWVSGNLGIGSGYLDGDGPAHLPAHATFDLSIGRSFGERLSLRLTALNLSNHRYMLDNSSTFGGTHFNYPRQISISLWYRFHY